MRLKETMAPLLMTINSGPFLIEMNDNIRLYIIDSTVIKKFQAFN